MKAKRPRAPILEVKREVGSSIESAEFVLDNKFDVEPEIRVGPAATAAGSSSARHRACVRVFQRVRRRRGTRPVKLGGRSAPLSRIPEGDLGPADPPRRRGRPKGSKTRPRVAFCLVTLPEQKEKVEAERCLAQMKLSKKQV